jgi:hypothetical protein
LKINEQSLDEVCELGPDSTSCTASYAQLAQAPFFLKPGEKLIISMSAVNEFGPGIPTATATEIPDIDATDTDDQDKPD